MCASIPKIEFEPGVIPINWGVIGHWTGGRLL
jgi:hypothetical protein